MPNSGSPPNTTENGHQIPSLASHDVHRSLDPIPNPPPPLCDAIPAPQNQAPVPKSNFINLTIDKNRLAATVTIIVGFFFFLTLFLADKGLIPLPFNESRREQSSYSTREITPAFDASPAPARRDPVTAFGEQLRDHLYRAAARGQERQRAEREESYRRMTDNTCSYCKGAGSFNYVDNYGNLQQSQCPKCFGLGRTGTLFGP